MSILGGRRKDNPEKQVHIWLAYPHIIYKKACSSSSTLIVQAIYSIDFYITIQYLFYNLSLSRSHIH